MTSTSHYHAITGDSALEVPVGPLGGIIADTMGLGKTVTTLSTIASTLLPAKEWGKRKGTPWSAGLRTAAATMVVVPNEGEMRPWYTIQDARPYYPSVDGTMAR